ncbi:MAG: toxin HicA [Deltaproteobacteria bacterium]|nr:toxin HicA [Deltaproteobacteria bacterium]
MRLNRNTRFAVALKIATKLFGAPRIKGDHHVFKMPWAGDPRVNLQPQGNKAKDYQVEQILKAIERLEKENAE